MNRRRRGAAVFAAAAATLLLLPGAALGATYTVASSGDDTGVTPCDPSALVCPTLRDAINDSIHVSAGSTILIGSGVYLSHGQLQIGRSLTLQGTGSASSTSFIWQATTGGARVIWVMAGATVNIVNMALIHGDPTGTAGSTGSSGGTGGFVDGGAVLNDGTLTLRGSSVLYTYATGGSGGAGTAGGGGNGGSVSGGAVFNSGSLTLISSFVAHTTIKGGQGGTGTAYGGAGGDADAAIFNAHYSGQPAGTLVLENSSVSANTATGGAAGSGGSGAGTGATGGGAEAGIESFGGNVLITGSTLDSSVATGGAGGSRSGGTGGYGGTAQGPVEGTETVLSSTISNNTADGGAGGAASGGGAGGTGGGAYGGGVYGVLTLVNSTVSGNQANAGAGSGVAPGDGGGALLSDSASMANDTLASNTASNVGGNLALDGLAHITITDTIIAHGSSHYAANSNCDVTQGTVADNGHNLEQSTPSQCGFTQPSDLIGQDPLFGPLRVNAPGSTATMALQPGSPAIDAGGQCPDPTNSGQPLATDERGVARGSPCDIGAYEASNPPVNTAAPSVAGAPQVGAQLSCSQGTWGGDTPQSYSYQWLRDGTAIPGAGTALYNVALADRGHQLSCRVTAINDDGQASADSAVLAIPGPPSDGGGGGGGGGVGGLIGGGGGGGGGGGVGGLIIGQNATAAISRLRVAPNSFRAADHGAAFARRRRHATGAKVSYTDSLASNTTFTVLRATPGALGGGHCARPPKRRKRHQRKCTYYMPIGAFTRQDVVGANSFHFSGRVNGRKLTAGSYRLAAAPLYAGRSGTGAQASFAIRRR